MTKKSLYFIKEVNFMKHFLMPLFMIMLGALAGCCTHAKFRHPDSRALLVTQMRNDTVALVRSDGETVRPFCTGVWVGKNQILSADHCVRAAVEDLVLEIFSEEDNPDVIEEQIQLLEDGFKINFIVSAEERGVFREPVRWHTAEVVKHDSTHDLVLLKVDSGEKDIPEHSYAKLAKKSPSVGADVSIMGHVVGLYWTFTRGIVSAYREEEFLPIMEDGKLGPFMQVAGEVFKGNSGGGAFSEDGELVGIASFMPPVMNECFFIHLETIRSFLGQPRPR